MKKGNLIFGGMFFLAGLISFFFVVVKPIYEVVSMQNWIQTQAQLVSAEVSSYQSRNDDNSYTTMYTLDIEYRYIVDNVSISGNRASIQNMSSSDSSDAYTLLSKLKWEQQQYGHIKVWYNPDSPRDSVCSRELAIKFLIMMAFFSLTFMLAGLGIMLYKKTNPSRNRVTNPDPAKPWTTLPQWCSPKVYSNAKQSLKAAWLFAAVGSTFYGMFAVSLIGENVFLTAVSLSLLILPLWLIKRALRIQKEWKTFQEVPLEMTTYPGVIGGKVTGHITVPVMKDSEDKYKVTLCCVKHWKTRSGNKTQHKRSVIWSEVQIPHTRPRANGTYLRFDFDVPPALPESSEPSNSYHVWLLKVDGKLLETDFNRNYELPVFVTDDSISIEEELKQNPLSKAEKIEMSERLSLEESQEKITLSASSAKGSLPIAGIGVLFFIVGLFIWFLAEQVFGIVFSSMAMIFIGLGMYGWVRNCKIVVVPGEIHVDVYLKNKLWKSHTFKKEDIESITTYRSSASHTNGKMTSEYFSLILRNKQGKRFDLGGDFSSIKRATHLKTQIEQMVGLTIT